MTIGRKTLLLRIRPELWENLNRWAVAEFRSVNGQIEFLLQRASDEKFGGRDGSQEDRPVKGRQGPASRKRPN